MVAFSYRYDPHINISDEYSTEEDRINLLTTIAEVFFLNTTF